MNRANKWEKKKGTTNETDLVKRQSGVTGVKHSRDTTNAVIHKHLRIMNLADIYG